ncbi:flagellar basal body P-ring formation chaperone FlgA [uncultured Aliiroseovarius sp.]|uniref:flagellar basal body P-ring formation chaperone FlgA n=1 Tax=uncultured Aliiroseovarius sp. TaxID=1658783 RepID=UPI0026295830|nr:flagellar basal body P-ring formation chaperone FlgA [uncultured Aliiroseovarius sp.]
MRVLLSIFLLAFGSSFAVADTVVAARNIRHNTVIAPSDLKLVATDMAGGFTSIEDVVGQEARVVLYAGRPVLANDIGPPALVERNQIVSLIYATGPLMILAEGRSLARAGVGDRIRVMNLMSRTTVTGSVAADGSVLVSQPHFQNR